MATRRVTLAELKVAELKAELEEREYDTAGKKQVLQQRLRQALKDEGKDTENYLFDFQLMEQSIAEKIADNSSKLEEKNSR